jgi:hypothetical protein
MKEYLENRGMTIMDFYIVFTERQKDKIELWKKTLPKLKAKVVRSFGIIFVPTDNVNKDGRRIFKAYFKSSDGHKFFVTKKAILH